MWTKSPLLEKIQLGYQLLGPVFPHFLCAGIRRFPDPVRIYELGHRDQAHLVPATSRLPAGLLDVFLHLPVIFSNAHNPSPRFFLLADQSP